MEIPTSAKTGETSEPTNWSILDGEFIPSPDFPSEEETQIIKGKSAIHPIELTQRRVYYTELLIYALRYVNPAVDNDPELIGQIRRGLIDQTVDVMYRMGDTYRKQDIKEMAEELIGEPMGSAKEVPVMQALKAMQESGAIDYGTRTMLDAIVRGIYIKQTGAKL